MSLIIRAIFLFRPDLARRYSAAELNDSISLFIYRLEVCTRLERDECEK